MSGVALDVPVGSIKQRSFGRILLAVVLGYVGAVITFGLAALPLLFLWAMPRPWVWPGPFPIDGVWSLAADIVVAALIVLVTAWWIRRMVESAVRGHVSLAVVALPVAVFGCIPVLVAPAGFLSSVIIAPLVTTWVVRRYAVDPESRLPKLSWRVCVALAVVGFVVLGSYRVYHPLVTAGLPADPADFTLKNSDWANMTILRVDGGVIKPAEGRIHRLKLPYALRGRRDIGVYSNGRPCVRHEVVITYSVLGVTSTQRFSLTSDAPNFGSSADLPDGAGCGESP
jgi:hypothetical protein